MSKVRVYELARELKMESKALVDRLKKLGVDVASHQSTLSADQVVRIKRDLQGAGAGADGSPKVIRRRRRETEPDDEQVAGSADDESSELEAAPPPPPVIRKKASVAAAKEDKAGAEEPQTSPVVDKKEQSPAEKVAATAAKEKSEAASETEPKKVQASEEPKDKDIAVAEAERAGASAQQQSQTEDGSTEDAMSPMETAEDLSVQRPSDAAHLVQRRKTSEARAPQNSGGATIVRRASPEEVEARRVAKQHKERPPLKKDWRGGAAAATGNRPPQQEAPGFRNRLAPKAGPAGSGAELQPPPLMDEETFASVRSKEFSRVKDKEKKRTAATAEEEANAVRKLPPKQKRDQFNLRTILKQIEDVETEPEADAEAPAAPVPDPVVAKNLKRKTVYTPSASNRKRDLKRRRDLKKTQITTPKASLRVVKMGHEITIGELAKQLSVKAGEIIKKLMTQGMMVTINQPVDFDTASLVASEYDFEVKSSVVSLDDIFIEKRKIYEAAESIERPPIVTIMGHVDHGKTSILDAIRKAKVADAEAGGITQHIGAYKVEKDGREIAFLDTPGHEAFSSMRSRGAQVTDIVVLVVAADDGVMPQTIEAISHARAANVPIIVAVNKMDKPNINLDRVYRELMEHAIQSEEWGGETQFVKVSAIKGTGLDELLEAILLQAEILELKAAIDVPACGVVVEAHLDKGRGPVATIMVQRGTLNVGDQLVAGTVVGRVRAMYNHRGQKVKDASPSTPVEVIGLSDVPMAGDSVDVVEDERTAREAAAWRKEQEERRAGAKSSAASLEELLSKVKQADTPEVPIILKADTQGSVEAIAESILKLNNERVRNRIVHKGVGGVNESDLSLAETSNAVVVAFNVRTARGLDDLAEKKGILIRYFGVIYDIVDTLKAIMAGKLPPIQKEVIQGHAEVRQTIRVPKIGTVAGTAVLDGKVTRHSQVRLIRDDVVIFSGRIGSLRRFKDDVKEVMQGYECGIGIEGYNDLREGDVIETFVIEEQAPAL